MFLCAGSNIICRNWIQHWYAGKGLPYRANRKRTRRGVHYLHNAQMFHTIRHNRLLRLDLEY